MIVYGDPSYTASFSELLDGLWKRVNDRIHQPEPLTLDQLRALLIYAGQVQQAVDDAGLPELRNIVRVCGGKLSDLFVEYVRAGKPSDEECIQYLKRSLRYFIFVPEDRDAQVLSQLLTVKHPEGFAFYTLYPEAYVAAVQNWLGHHGVSDETAGIRVVGVRSIGTTLGMVACSALPADCFALYSSIRPTGHPYSREASIAQRLTGFKWAFVVDEGPGVSGSSMAAVAEALHKAGVPENRIVFFPGHGGDPAALGQQPENVRRWWWNTPRYVVPLSELRWDGLSLTETLAKRLLELAGEGDADLSAVRIDDMGGGLWRRFAFPDADPADWPAANVPFERTKYRCTTPGGAQVLWKFAGLGFEEETRQAMARRAEAGWSPEPLGTALGFLATRWIDGDPLTVADAADPAVLAHVGRYLAAVAGPPLTDEERDAAWERTAEMVYWNVWEGVGEEAAARVRDRFADVADVNRAAKRPSYGDGRLAPWEWVRATDSRLCKTDPVGHDRDHTMVGRQPLEWDVAGALVEWDLWDGDPPAARAEPLLAPARVAGAATDGPLLTAYVLAYAAFRLGMVTLCAQSLAHDPDEQARLYRAADRFRRLLMLF